MDLRSTGDAHAESQACSRLAGLLFNERCSRMLTQATPWRLTANQAASTLIAIRTWVSEHVNARNRLAPSPVWLGPCICRCTVSWESLLRDASTLRALVPVRVKPMPCATSDSLTTTTEMPWSLHSPEAPSAAQYTGYLSWSGARCTRLPAAINWHRCRNTAWSTMFKASGLRKTYSTRCFWMVVSYSISSGTTGAPFWVGRNSPCAKMTAGHTGAWSM